MLLPFLFLCGAIIGSFLIVVVDRLRVGGSIFWPPSHCETCNTKLRPIDMVPLLSYLRTRGRCSFCSAEIPRHLFFGELSTGMSVVGAYLLANKVGVSDEFVIIITGISVLAVLSVLFGLRRNVPVAVMVLALIGAASIAPFWATVGADRPFSFGQSLLGSELNAGLAALLAVLAYCRTSATMALFRV